MSIYKNFEDRLGALASKKLRPHTREASLILVENAGGDPLLGIQYSCDFRSEEETGTGEMTRLFTQAAHSRSFFAREYLLQENSKGLLKDLTQAELVLITDELIIFQAKRNLYKPERQLDAALKFLKDATIWRDGRSELRSKYWHSTVAELKDLAKARGLKGYSKLKHQELTDLLADMDHAELHADDPFEEVLSQPGWFHYGSLLIFERKDTLFTEVLLKLVEAAKAGYLVVGSGGIDAFGNGFSLFDSRDLTKEAKEKISAQNRWYREQMALLKPVAEAVKAEPMGGYYALGNPSSRENGPVAYWLNGYSVRFPNGRSGQPFGWYTLDELLAEKYMEDARVASDESFKRYDQQGNSRRKLLTDEEAEAELKERGLSWASKSLASS